MTNTALIVVDFQNDYFPGGLMELSGIETAGQNGKALLDHFRAGAIPIFIIQHLFESAEAPFFRPDSDGAKIRSGFTPVGSDQLIVKHKVNSFQGTELQENLKALNIETVVICGAMSHMCIDATTRAAADFGYKCIVVHDACATTEQEFNGVNVPAKQVHASFMAALGFAYAELVSTQDYLARH